MVLMLMFEKAHWILNTLLSKPNDVKKQLIEWEKQKIVEWNLESFVSDNND